jgi:mannose-6-phosphate isomerase-like protein (cupin superfamily)
MPRSLIALVVLCVASMPVGAQNRTGRRPAGRTTAAPASFTARRPAPPWQPRYDLVSAGALSSGADWLARHPAHGLTGNTLLTSSDEQTTYLLVQRTIASEPEVHARWEDLVIVRAGTGVIVLGDSLIGSRYRAPGERIGGRFHRNFQLVVHAGDIVRIPAAVPHEFIATSPRPLEYLLIKQRHQELPIRWYEKP